MRGHVQPPCVTPGGNGHEPGPTSPARRPRQQRSDRDGRRLGAQHVRPEGYPGYAPAGRRPLLGAPSRPRVRPAPTGGRGSAAHRHGRPARRPRGAADRRGPRTSSTTGSQGRWHCMRRGARDRPPPVHGLRRLRSRPTAPRSGRPGTGRCGRCRARSASARPARACSPFTSAKPTPTAGLARLGSLDRHRSARRVGPKRAGRQPPATVAEHDRVAGATAAAPARGGGGRRAAGPGASRSSTSTNGPGMVSGVTGHRSAERGADAREEAGVGGSDLVAPLLGELPQQVLLLRA